MNYYCETCKLIIPTGVANTLKACPGCRKPLLLSFGDDSALLARGFTHYTPGSSGRTAPPPPAQAPTPPTAPDHFPVEERNTPRHKPERASSAPTGRQPVRPTRTQTTEPPPAPKPAVRQVPTPTPPPQRPAESLERDAAGRNQVTGGPIGHNGKQNRDSTLFQVILFLVAVAVCGTVLYVLWVKRHAIIQAVTGIILFLLLIFVIALVSIPRRRR